MDAHLVDLIGRVERAQGPDRALDMAVAIAIFKPDRRHISVMPNAAGTKLVYSRPSGKTDTHWAYDYTLNDVSKARALALLHAVDSRSKEGK